MVKEYDMMQDIKGMISGIRKDWCIGITADVRVSNNTCMNPAGWMHWEVETEEGARNIEWFFMDIGVRRCQFSLTTQGIDELKGMAVHI